ncbi:MAG: glycosyltransferase family 9 protein [Candidatus Omnitrophica bacterium]|nr:glycosyltransferase family 9 protein [Candidatus Omnitrophota bacterium]
MGNTLGLIKIIAAYTVYYFTDMSVWLFPAPKADRGNGLKTVLLVRPDSAGDFILWLDAAKEYRRIYPPDIYKITLLVNKDWAELARGYNYWDELVLIDRTGFFADIFYRWRLLRQIYRSHYTVTIHPVFTRLLPEGDSIVRVSRSRERIGWELYERFSIPGIFSLKKMITRSWYTRLVSLDMSRIMEIEKNAQFVHALGLKDYKPGITKLAVSRKTGLVKGDYFVVAPDALWEGREWPLENFIELSGKIKQATGWTPVFTGSRRGLKKKTDNALRNTGYVNLFGKTHFMEFLAVIADAKMVIGNESSAIHIAVATGVKAFSITGGGHWGRFVPYAAAIDDGRKPITINKSMPCYQCEWVCRLNWTKGPVQCIKQISTDEAWETISKVLLT